MKRFGRLPAALIVLMRGVGLSFAINLPQSGVDLVSPVALNLALPQWPGFPFETCAVSRRYR
jgi:hypothetical protein